MTPRELQEAYERGANVSALLRRARGASRNDERIIEASYDLQAGSYVAAMADPDKRRKRADLGAAVAATIRALCDDPVSLLEPGVGEAVTLAEVLRGLGTAASAVHAFDLCWSRVAYARRWLAEQGRDGVALATGSLFQLPYADDSVDVVYTVHAVEPNGGREREVLRELHRVARRFVVLLEPGYEIADAEARRRMESHGYCRDLPGAARELGYEVVEHRRFEVQVNPSNPTALTVLRKRGAGEPPGHVVACPQHRTPLVDLGDALYSPEALAVYPVLGGIPCLRVDNAVVASAYPRFAGSGKPPGEGDEEGQGDERA